MQVSIVFTHRGSSAKYGNFAPGDMVKCSAEEAKHFVEDAGCARYDDGAKSSEPAAKKPVKQAGKKASGGAQ